MKCTVSSAFLIKEPIYNLTLKIYASFAMCLLFLLLPVVNYLSNCQVVETLSLNGYFQSIQYIGYV